VTQDTGASGKPDRATHEPSPDGLGHTVSVPSAVADALLAVVEATRAYLPPDGISAQECLNRILSATDNPTINPIIREIEQCTPEQITK
jgi:hypothetical protein